MKITIYTAGPWKDREQVKEIANKLREANYVVNSRWLDVDPTTPEGMTQDEYYRAQALHDLEDCIGADLLIFCNTGTLSEGKATELGIAIATLKPIIIVGEGGRNNNIFLHLNIPQYNTIEECIEWMKSEEMKANLMVGVR